MKYIKDRNRFIKENKDIIKDDALDILSDHDQSQSPELKQTLDALDHAPAKGKVVTRFAPSPTGSLHIGGVRTAIYNYLFAKKHGGVFYLRIEDTDSSRFVGSAEDQIKRTLEWIGIEPDYSPWNPGPNGPYRQSERDYTQHIKTLIDGGHAYYAFDDDVDMEKARTESKFFSYNVEQRMKMKNSLTLSKEETERLISEGQKYVVRFKMPEEKINVPFNDIIRGSVKFSSAELDDKVLVKSDGIPTYHLANVCDDHDMGTTHVIRGEEWLSSTGLHILLYKAFGWEAPEFAHLPLLLNPDGKGKLSKRMADKYGFPVFAVEWESSEEPGTIKPGFKEIGYEPDALVNFLVLLGWSPGNDIEQMTMAEMISKFDLKRVQKGGARFDIKKAQHFNSLYIKGRSNKDLLKYIDQGDTFKYDESTLDKIVEICKNRITFVSELNGPSKVFFYPVVLSDDMKSKISQDFKTVMVEFLKRCQGIEWKADIIKQLIYDICIELGIKMGGIMPSMRLAIAAGIAGPDLPTTMEIVGKDESINRINNSL